MNSQAMEKFLQEVSANKEAQEKIKGIGDDMDALAAYARELGHDVSPRELREHQDKALELLKANAKKKLEQPDVSKSPGTQAFYALLKLGEDDESVAERLAELAAGTPAELVAYGKEKGFDFSERDIQAAGEYFLEPSNELSEEELELAAGGTTVLLFVGILAFGGFALGTAVVAVAVAFAVTKKEG